MHTNIYINNIITGDSIGIMSELPDKSIDLILCDLPYGTTDCEWDKCLPMDELWEQYRRIIKLNSAILLFAQQPFATRLINAGGRMFRYQIIWEKAKSLGFLNVKRMPLRAHEMILVFYSRLPAYNPQMTPGKPYVAKDKRREKMSVYKVKYKQYKERENTGWRYPRDVVRFAQPTTAEGLYHPTQKPLALLEYLIKTYSNHGDIMLDNACGSGSACVAALNTGRRYIGIELNDKFAQIARARLNTVKGQISCRE